MYFSKSWERRIFLFDSFLAIANKQYHIKKTSCDNLLALSEREQSLNIRLASCSVGSMDEGN